MTRRYFHSGTYYLPHCVYLSAAPEELAAPTSVATGQLEGAAAQLVQLNSG